VRRFFRRARLDQERAREMQAHLDHHVDDLVARGVERGQAVREARRRFGHPLAIREEVYEMNSIPLLDPFVRDLRQACRMLKKTPGFTIAAVLTLALGIGANTAVFSVVDALLFTRLPYPRSDRLGLLERRVRTPDGGEHRGFGANGRVWFALRDDVTTVEAAVLGVTSGVNLLANERALYVHQQRVSAGYFGVMGVPPRIGREFTGEEDVTGGPAVAVLSHGLWTRAFESDPAIVGRTIRLRGDTYTVVGVMPEDFQVTQRSSLAGGSGVDLWTPLRPSTSGEGAGTNYQVVLRLKDGVSWPEAAIDVKRASASAFPALPAGTVAELGVVPMRDAMVAGVRQPLLVLWGATAIVLLIACVNIAGLLLARGAARTREIATRMALGSGRAGVVRQMFAESGVLAVLGGAAGVLVGWVVLKTLGVLGAEVFDLWQPLALNARVLAATTAAALATSLVVGLLPAVDAGRLDVGANLGKAGSRGVAGGKMRWARRALVAGEVALGVVLLVAAGLLVRTFVHLRYLDPGFHEEGLLAASVSLQDARYANALAVQQLYDDSLRRIRATPGVESAGVALGMPYTRLLNDVIRRLDGPEIDPPERWQMTNVSYVTPGFFETLEIPLRQGRLVTQADTSVAPGIAVVNEAFVSRYYRGTPSVIGRRVLSSGQTREIVGVVGNVQQGASGLGDVGPIGQIPCLYLPVSQASDAFLTTVHTWFEPWWAVRSPLPTAVGAVREAIQSVDAGLPVARLETIASLRGERLAAQRFTMSLAGGLGVLALLLSAIGLHGLIASGVNERTRELGIRLALGATAMEAARVVVVPGIALTGVGVVVGLAGSIAATRLLRSFLWGTTASDPVTIAAVVLTLIVVAVVASLLPALRVWRLDPAVTLRAE
jgi:predicted permease